MSVAGDHYLVESAAGIGTNSIWGADLDLANAGPPSYRGVRF